MPNLTNYPSMTLLARMENKPLKEEIIEQLKEQLPQLREDELFVLADCLLGKKGDKRDEDTGINRGTQEYEGKDG